MKFPSSWLSSLRPLSFGFALILGAASASGCGDKSSPPATGLAASVIGEWRPSDPELDRVAGKLFTRLRKAYPLKPPGDEKVSDLEAVLGGTSAEHVEKMRAMPDSELRSYARTQADAMALILLQGGKAEWRSGFGGQSAPTTWRIDGDHLVVEASLDAPNEKAPKRDPTTRVVIRFKLAEETLVVEDVQFTGFDDDQSLFPRTWQRAASRDG